VGESVRKWDFFTFFGLEKWECTMFLGEYRAKLDSKGRVCFPAPLRRQDDSAVRGSYVLKRGAFGKHLVIYTSEEFYRQVELVKAQVNRYSKEGDAFIREFYKNTEEQVLDPSDRLLLSKRNLEFLGGGSEVVFLGRGDSLEIWSAAEYDRAQMDLETYAALTEKMLGDAKGLEG